MRLVMARGMKMGCDGGRGRTGCFTCPDCGRGALYCGCGIVTVVGIYVRGPAEARYLDDPLDPLSLMGRKGPVKRSGKGKNRKW